MTHEEIKDSIAAYSIGALDAAEHAEVERHLTAGCAECAGLLKEMQQVAALLPFTVQPETPPAGLKARLLRQIAPEPETTAMPGEAVGVAALETAVRRYRRLSLGLAVALGAAIIGILWLAANFQHEMNRLEAEIGIREQTIETLQLQLEEKERIFQIVRSPQVRIVELAGQRPAPGARGRVMLAAGENNAVFIAAGLPEPPPDRDYQLWMLRGTQPVDAGVVIQQIGDAFIHPFQLIPDVERLSAFALTLEPKGGAPQPTGEMYLLGSITGN